MKKKTTSLFIFSTYAILYFVRCVFTQPHTIAYLYKILPKYINRLRLNRKLEFVRVHIHSGIKKLLFKIPDQKDLLRACLVFKITARIYCYTSVRV